MNKESASFLVPPDDIIFNPNEYTEKELLKLVYRELHKLREEFDDYRKNNTWQKDLAEQEKRITTLENEIKLQKELREQADKRTNRIVMYVGLGFTAITIILKFFV